MARQSQKNGGEVSMARFSTVVKKNHKTLTAKLPSGLDPERFLTLAWSEIESKPDVKEVAVKYPGRVFRALLGCAAMGLYPDGFNGQAYLVRYGKELEKATVVAMRGYKGMIQQFSENNPDAAAIPIVVDLVRENDELIYERGAMPILEHRPARRDRGEVTHVYAVARFKDGSYLPLCMELGDVKKFKQYSKTPKFWESKEENTVHWMWKKTVIRQLFKELPLSTAKKITVDQEEALERGEIVPEDFLELTAGDEPIEGAEVKPTEAIPVQEGNDEELPNHPPTEQVVGSDDAKLFG